MAPEETPPPPAEKPGDEPKKGSQMSPEEKAKAIEAAKAKAAAAKAAKAGVPGGEAAGGPAVAAAVAPAAATPEASTLAMSPAETKKAVEAAMAKSAVAAAADATKTGEAKAEGTAAAKPAEAAKPAAAAAAAKPAEAKEPVEVREGRQLAGGIDPVTGKNIKVTTKPNKEEIIAKALEKIRLTEKALTAKAPSPELTRRELFMKAGWAGFGAYAAFLGLGFARFFFPRVLFEPPTQFRAGFPNEYTVGEVSTKYKDTNRTWIVREATGFYAIFARCTHLGCTPMWLEGEQKFKCPCHGSGYTKEAINYEGPAPRPMERCFITLADDGKLLVDTSRRFRYEEGQWDNAGAYLRYA